MFLDFYQLREQPFGVTPDPRYLYLSNTHREALASLVYGIETGRGFMALIGPPGMGKTTLLLQLLERWMGNARTVYLFQTQCDSRELLRYLLADLGLDGGDHDIVRMHAQLNELLLREARLGKRVVLVIDEAQNLDNSVLEMVRLLSDFETPNAKLLHIILAGQPELASKLAQPGLVQLRQRIALFSRLHPFSTADTDFYITHRLWVAGYKGRSLFTAGARALIAKHSEGIPRNINSLCFCALSLGYALKRKTIDSSILEEVIADLNIGALVPQKPSDSPQAGPVSLSAPLSSYRPIQKAAVSRVAFLAAALCILFVLLASLFVNAKQSAPARKPSQQNDPQSQAVAIMPSFKEGREIDSSQAASLPAPIVVLEPSHRKEDEIDSSQLASLEVLTVVVKPNDTLSEIIFHYLGRFDQELASEICELNPELTNPNLIRIGDRIRLPVRSGPLKGESLVYGPGNERKP